MIHSPQPASKPPIGNETSGIAYFSTDAPVSIGQKIRQFRLKSRKTRQQLAKEWGVSPKTLWGWETGQREPSPLLKKRIGEEVFGGINGLAKNHDGAKIS